MKENSFSREQIVLQSLVNCGRTILKSTSFKQSARSVYEVCKDMIGATAGYVALLSADETLNEILFLDMGDLPCSVNPNLPMPIRGFRAKAYLERDVMYENNFPQSEWAQYLPKGHCQLDNVLFAPLVIDEKAVGILGFGNKSGGFCDDDVLVVKAFAELAAIGLLKNRTLESLQKNAAHLSALMQTANDAIVTVDQGGKISFWNKAAENCFGYSFDEIVGQSCMKIIPENYKTAHQEAFAKAVNSGISKLAGQQVEVHALKKDGKTVPVELSMSKWEFDEVVFFTGIIRDISKRKQMEEETKRAEIRLREVFKFMKGGGGVYQAVDDGEDFIIVDFCRPDLEDLRTNNESLIGQRILDVFPASREYGLFDVFQRVWKTGVSEQHPVTIYDGNEITGWRENYVYRLSSGEIVALYEDITEKKQLELALLDNWKLFRTIFEISPDPVNITRLDDGKFIVVNQRFLELTGFTKSEVIGKTALDIGVWDDLGERQKFFAQIIDRGQVKDFEARFRRKDGSILTALVSAKMLDYHDQPHLLAVSRDITELKNTEQALFKAHQELEERYDVTTEKLKESEFKYSALVEALLTGVYMCSGDKLVFYNKQITKIFGYNKDELLNTKMRDLIHSEDRETFREMQKKTLSRKKEESEFEVRGVKKNGDIIYLLGRNTVIDYMGHKAILANITDISKRKLAEKEWKKSEHELQILSTQLLSAEEKERKRIAGDIHDSIGQALSAIKFSVENSLSSLTEESNQAARDALNSIVPLTQQTIEEVRRIVMDLRPSILDDLGLHATISWFCREFESIYTDISIEQALNFEESDISAPLKTVIYRILQEAFNNAAKYSRTESILLHIEETTDNLELLIEDKGIGFDVNEVELRSINQRGVGLASMRERALLSGGTFDIKSSPREGTRVYASWSTAAMSDDRKKNPVDTS